MWELMFKRKLLWETPGCSVIRLNVSCLTGISSNSSTKTRFEESEFYLRTNNGKESIWAKKDASFFFTIISLPEHGWVELKEIDLETIKSVNGTQLRSNRHPSVSSGRFRIVDEERPSIIPSLFNSRSVKMMINFIQLTINCSRSTSIVTGSLHHGTWTNKSR